jgi:hypothetical protein
MNASTTDRLPDVDLEHGTLSIIPHPEVADAFAIAVDGVPYPFPDCETGVWYVTWRAERFTPEEFARIADELETAFNRSAFREHAVSAEDLALIEKIDPDLAVLRTKGARH